MTGTPASATPSNPASNGSMEAALAMLESKRAAAAEAAGDNREEKAPAKRKEPADKPKAKDQPEPEESDDAQREEDEADETEAEAEEEDAAPDDAEDEEDDTEEFVQLKDGSKVPVSEVVDGYMRQADYTRKTQALTDERKSIEAERGKAQEERERLKGLVGQYDEALKAFSGVLDSEGDKFKDFWGTYRKLKGEDPIAAEQFKADRDEWLEKKQTVDAERKRRAEEAAKEAEAEGRQAQKRLADTILAQFPQWQDKEVANRDWAKMVKMAEELGYTQADIARNTDPRPLVMLYWAAQGKDARSKVESAKRGDLEPKTKKPDKIRILRPKASRPSGSTTRRSQLQQAEATARKTGEIGDVYALMQAKKAAAARQ